MNANGTLVPIDQTNNSYIFPGLALGVISSQARRVSDGMAKAAALALAGLSPTLNDKRARLLPPLEDIRSVSGTVARAAGLEAIREGLTPDDERGVWRQLLFPADDNYFSRSTTITGSAIVL